MTLATLTSSLSPVHRAEILIVLVALFLLAFAPKLERSALAVAFLTLVGAGVAVGFGLFDSATGNERMALVVSGAVMAVAGLLLHTAELFDERQRPESAALVLIGGIGAIVLATASSLVELAIGVEMISLAGAALVAFGRGQRPLEGGFKYFLLTAVTFATLLFGTALVFVGTGSFALPSSTSAVAGLAPLVAAGVGLICVGLAFKLALVPVHFGALDAYTAGPSVFVGFVMIASKLGAAVALARLAGQMGAPIEALMLGTGIVTIGFGVVASFAQVDLRRLLAYSAVAHAGFLAVAASADVGGLEAARFYVIGYGAAALLAFAALAGTGTDGYAMSKLGPSTSTLGKLRSFALLLALMSLAGVPPLPGFWAKLAVLKASWDSWGLAPTVLVALGGVVGIIYYLKPMPDLLAATTSARSERPAPVAVMVLTVVVAALSFAPGVAWLLAR